MTYKHGDFLSSPTMRSLVKVAQNKGWIKEEPLSKVASIDIIDITPTDNLMENIFKLCSELKVKGLVKEAIEIETNYLNYKKAQTLYETSKEEGKDLIEFAHREGG